MRRSIVVVFVCMLLVGLVSQSGVAQAATPQTKDAPVIDGYVPVAIWTVDRVDMKDASTVRHSWVAGSDKMLKVTYGDNIWYGFKPVFLDIRRGQLAFEVYQQTPLDKAADKWKHVATFTVLDRKPGSVKIASPDGKASAAEFLISVIELKEVSPAEIKKASAEDGTKEWGEHCCASCGSTLACDCAVCLPECGDFCCVGGCWCPPCT